MRRVKQVFSVAVAVTVVMQFLVFGELHMHAEGETQHTVSGVSQWADSSFPTSEVGAAYPKGTAGSVAAALLLRYYDLEHHSAVLSSSFSSIQSAYEYLKINTEYGPGKQAYPKDDARAVNLLLSKTLQNAPFGARAESAAFYETAAMQKILENKPVVLYTKSSTAEYPSTAVVAYAFQSTEAGQTFTVHTGTVNAQGGVYGVTMDSSEFEWMMWIDTVTEHTHQMEYAGFDLTGHTRICAHEHCAVTVSQSHSYTLEFSGQIHEYLCGCGLYLAQDTHDCRTDYCSLCDAATSHDLIAATCTQAAYCRHCNQEVGDALGHALTDISDADGHGQQCTRCQEIFDFEQHMPSVQYYQTASQHYHKCTVCDWALEYQNHTLIFTGSTSSVHTQTCTVCNYETSFDHDKVYDQTESTHRERCTICGYTSEYSAHTWSGYQSNGSDHWQICTVCGYVTQNAAHSWSGYRSNSSGHWRVCTVCNYASATQGHNMAWQYDSSYHYYRCSVCSYQASSGTHSISRNCEQAWCTVCPYSNWDGYGHSYGSNGYCSSCGASDPNYTPHTHSYYWQSEYLGRTAAYCRHEWYACSCGDTYGHTYYDHVYTYPGGSCIECSSYFNRQIVLAMAQGTITNPSNKSDRDDDEDTEA